MVMFSATIELTLVPLCMIQYTGRAGASLPKLVTTNASTIDLLEAGRCNLEREIHSQSETSEQTHMCTYVETHSVHEGGWNYF